LLVRLGELRGLCKTDIDVKHRIVRIRDTTSKFSKSRTIPLGTVRIARLKAHPEWIAPEKIGDKCPSSQPL